jgi:hypothetical protein
VPKHHSHLTTEQFSAFLDQQLSVQEQSTCQAHLSTCELCQQQLAELQQTVLLVRALPRVPVPRSFVLPVEATIQSATIAEEEASTPQTAKPIHNRVLVLPRYVRTTMRIASSLVAVLGLFFILSGLLTIVSPKAETSRLSTPFEISTKIRAPYPSPNTHQVQPLAGAAASSPNVPHPQILVGAAASSSNASQPQLPAGPANPQTSDHLSSSPQQQLLISFFNLSTPEGHLSIGLLLFIAGIVSVILITRLVDPSPHR